MIKNKFRFGVVVFPGSNCDQDSFYVIDHILKQEAVPLWHRDHSVKNVQAIILPGGFSYGDYLRSGAIASHSPIMQAISDFAKQGGLVLGICNGFQILLESGLLLGAMKKNQSLRFICKPVLLRVRNTESPFTNQCSLDQTLCIPIAHGEGNYHPHSDIEKKIQNQSLLTYENNPNGSFNNIAGLTNQQGNILGMMPHPERCSEKTPLGNDGLTIFQSMLFYLQNS